MQLVPQILAVMIATTFGDAHEQTPTVSERVLPQDRRQAIMAFIEPFVELAMFDGTVLVDVGGEVILTESFGRAQYEFDVSHDAATRFRIASVSKTLTDAAFAKLAEQGRVDLQSSLAGYLPEFPSADMITLSSLLDHTSGIPHTNDQPWGETSLTISEIVERLAGLPLDFEPGTARSYSNGGYAVVARTLGGGTR